MHRSLLLVVLSLSLLLSPLVAAQDASYTFTTIDVPGASETWTFGINNNGQIVGMFITIDATGVHGYLKDGATFTTFDIPGATALDTLGINNNGQIVGAFADATGTHGYLKDGATFTTIDVSGARSTQAFAINDNGQIAGVFTDATGTHSFVATPAEVDTSPPVLTVTANPETLWPPNGQLVPVTVSGTIGDDEPDDSGVSSATYQVMDEYGQIQPGGSLTLGADGSYAFTVALQASRRGNDQDGRQYTIVVSATDNAGNLGSAPTSVTVPRN